MNHIKILAVVIACTVAGLSGCGGGNDGPPPSFTTTILSDPALDGDIEQTPGGYFVNQGMTAIKQSVFAGIDPATSNEFRTVLDFHLSGAGGVPGNAIIDSAFLDIFINSLQPASASLPLRIELLSFQPPTLIADDFDATPALAFVLASPDFTVTDVGTNASVDVTTLMEKAQNLGLVDFQIRIMEDLGPAILGLLEINDSTGSDRNQHGPQLTVTYF